MKQFDKYIILIADDDEDDIQFFEEALEELNENSVLITAKNGVELISYLEGSCEVPHVLFLDMNMPLKNGSECMKDIMQLDNCKDLLIVIYSTAINHQEIPTYISQGSRHYIQKPNDFAQIKKAIKTVLSILSEKLIYDKFVIDLDTLIDE
ncbi:MAG: response regulator [Spirosomaceae bacterium]|nr:response regulator [Spirosomataceae bacterium]